MTKQIEKLRIGVSLCLLGEKVRYDGQHKRNPYLMDVLAPFCSWVAVCPEVEIGMGTPREPIHLENKDGDIRLVARSGRDYTDQMQAYSQSRVSGLHSAQLDGYILKSKSPSCGMERVTVHGPIVRKNGRGRFADVLIKGMPHLPIEEEGRLNDARLRENFISRCYAYHRWQQLANDFSRKGLVDFHAQHKFQLLAHNQAGYRRLGPIVANPGNYGNDAELAEAYLAEFTATMSRIPTVRSHTNVLQHMAGFLPKDADATDRSELTGLIGQYRSELIPLIVPLTLLRHFSRKYEIAYLLDQVYLNPHPGELMLLNRV